MKPRERLPCLKRASFMRATIAPQTGDEALVPPVRPRVPLLKIG